MSFCWDLLTFDADLTEYAVIDVCCVLSYVGRSTQQYEHVDVARFLVDHRADVIFRGNDG